MCALADTVGCWSALYMNFDFANHMSRAVVGWLSSSYNGVHVRPVSGLRFIYTHADARNPGFWLWTFLCGMPHI